jgi:hypothetical protein
MLDPRTLGFHKLAALGALGACGGLTLVFLVIVVLLHPYPRGGMDGTHYALTLMAFAGIIAALIAVHLALAHQLWYAPETAEAREARLARGKRKARS